MFFREENVMIICEFWSGDFIWNKIENFDGDKIEVRGI